MPRKNQKTRKSKTEKKTEARTKSKTTRPKTTGSKKKKARKAARSTRSLARRSRQGARRSRSARSAARTAGQSGDLQGVSRRARADSESVDELLEEGNAFEAGLVSGVQRAEDKDEQEVRTREVPEDDVPEEYLDQDS